MRGELVRVWFLLQLCALNLNSSRSDLAPSIVTAQSSHTHSQMFLMRLNCTLKTAHKVNFGLWVFITIKAKGGSSRESSMELGSEGCCAVLVTCSEASVSTAVTLCSVLLRAGYQKSKERKVHDTSLTLKNIQEWKILCLPFVAPTAVLTAAR